jgi:sucrose-6-phosphate hydrolase SacC (GH32 family)
MQVGTYDYAGCMTVPRLLHLDGDRLVQCPAPELLALRQGEAWQASHVQLGGPQASLPVPGLVNSRCLDIEVRSYTRFYRCCVYFVRVFCWVLLDCWCSALHLSF